MLGIAHYLRIEDKIKRTKKTALGKKADKGAMVPQRFQGHEIISRRLVRRGNALSRWSTLLLVLESLRISQSSGPQDLQKRFETTFFVLLPTQDSPSAAGPAVRCHQAGSPLVLAREESIQGERDYLDTICSRIRGSDKYSNLRG